MNEYWNHSTPLDPENLNRLTRQIATDVLTEVGSEVAEETANQVVDTYFKEVKDAVLEANQATERTETAINTAEQAAERTETAINAAEQAAEGAERVNISALQTPRGAIVTVTDRNGVDTSVEIDTLTSVTSWKDIQTAIRLGLGPQLFFPGDEFRTIDSVTGASIVWAVRGHNHHVPANTRLTNSMTLEAKYVYSSSSGTYKSIVFDAPEAMYYAAELLPAGTYNFVWNYSIGSMVDGTYQFTLTQDVPAGGQIKLETNSSSTAITSCKISTYSGPASTTAIESGVVVTKGEDGVSLGTISSTSTTNELLNCAQRIMWGSNNYAQSAARQWLISSEDIGKVWTPTNVFDRPPSWHTTLSGFVKGLPQEFLEVVQPAIVPCRTNSVFEINSLDGTEFTTNMLYNLNDRFFMLSRPEIYGTWDSSSYKDGTLLEYYSGATNVQRIKYDESGVARTYWLRSPSPVRPDGERRVSTDGARDTRNAYYSYGIAPACIIA